MNRQKSIGIRLLAILIVAAMMAPAITLGRARSHSSRGGSRGGSHSRSSRHGSYARGRGSRMPSRWRRHVAVASATSLSGHAQGVHNFLTDSWSMSASGRSTPPSTSISPAGSPSMTAGGAYNTTTPSGATIAQLAANAKLDPPLLPPSAAPAAPGTYAAASRTGVVSSGVPTQTGGPGPTLASNNTSTVSPTASLENPLVNAYVDSLGLRGYSADNQGFIVETMDGKVLAEYNADRPFNPASVVKVVTSLAAISKLGADFMFRTQIYTDGTLDTSTGTLRGSLYVMGGGDPAFFSENAMMLADQLNQNGIRIVEGNLVVQGQFYFNFSTSREAAARGLKTCMDPESWGAAQSTAYQRFSMMRGTAQRYAAADVSSGTAPRMVSTSTGPPSLKITGETLTQPGINTANLKLVAVHSSVPLVRILKGQNDFSNNWMATQIGDLVGGPDAVKRFLEDSIGLRGDEIRLATSSGLGVNFISPRVMAEIFRKLIAYLDKKNIGLQDLLPVAGIDAGTLEHRFNDAFRGSVVGKTGTLGSQGVSALAGVAYTRTRGPLLFVIFNQRGSAYSFRAAQDDTIKRLITLYGGPAAVRYAPNM